ncbi:Uma2 family endonuclease [Nocardia callitridis]
MSPASPRLDDLPESMTWDELASLPAELATQIELHEGRVVIVRSGPPRHQRFYRRMANALEACARSDMRRASDSCWQVDVETNVFFADKSDFRTPDFLVYHCLNSGDQDIWSRDVVLVGEVLSPANTHAGIESKKAKYASAGIPWYWEADLDGDAISTIRAYALELSAELPDGVTPLRSRNYILVDEWSQDAAPGVEAHLPFPIKIPWAELAF